MKNKRGDEEESRKQGEKRGEAIIREYARERRRNVPWNSFVPLSSVSSYIVYRPSIVPDVAMSGAARVNEPFPGPLAAEYYIDNRNCLPSAAKRARVQDVLLGGEDAACHF